MILREWRGVTPAGKRDAYIAYMKKTGIKAQLGEDGNLGVMVTSRELPDGRCEIVILTLWESMEHVRAFAGGAPERARYYTKEQDFLVEMPTEVTHHEVLHNEGFGA
jgi:heme-degrading monooxygenase HmoA